MFSIFILSVFLAIFPLPAFNARVSNWFPAFTACQRLENGNTEIDAIGYYGGADGTDRFLVITKDNTVWDQSGSAFDPILHMVTLQELASGELDETKWFTLKENLNTLGLDRKGAIVRMSVSETNSADWLFFINNEDKKCHKVSLPTVSENANPTSCYVHWTFNRFQLVSAMPSEKQYAIGYQTMIGDYIQETSSPLCLYTIELTKEKKLVKKFLFNPKTWLKYFLWHRFMWVPKK